MEILAQLVRDHAPLGADDRRELARDVDVRADADARRRIVLADVGEQEQHQQRAAARGDVDAPLHEVGLVAAEADVHVPSAVAGIVGRGKAHREGAHGAAGQPATDADELIERRAQNGRVRGVDERRFRVHSEPDHRPGPSRGIVRGAPQVATQARAGRLGEWGRKGRVDADVAVGNEGVDLRGVERAHGVA